MKCGGRRNVLRLMRVRLLISRLASAQTRASAARGLAGLCGLGFLITVVVLAARSGLERWFFALLVWALFVYAPLRIVLEAAGTLAPALRRRLAAEAPEDPRRFTSAADTALAVDRLLEREVLMPRIATPVQREKARDGAIAVLLALRATAGARMAATAVALGCLEHWVAEIGPWAQREAGQNIQLRWREVRALAAMAAMTKVLLADETLAGTFGGPPDRSGGGPAGFLDACLDYCDDLALDVEVPSWNEPALDLLISPTHAQDVRHAWKVFVETGAPALEARKAFIDLLLASPQPTRSTVS